MMLIFQSDDQLASLPIKRPLKTPFDNLKWLKTTQCWLFCSASSWLLCLAGLLLISRWRKKMKYGTSNTKATEKMMRMTRRCRLKTKGGWGCSIRLILKWKESEEIRNGKRPSKSMIAIAQGLHPRGVDHPLAKS